MTRLILEFDWWRDLRGYARVADASGKKQKKDDTVVRHPFGIRVGLAEGDLPVIRRRGGALESYRPFKLGVTPHLTFANARSGEDLLKFVNIFGPLTKAGLDPKDGDRVAKLLVHAEMMRELLASQRLGQQALNAVINHEAIRFTTLEAQLIIDPAFGRPQLRITPPQLIDALWIALATSLSGQGNVSQCHHCDTWFETGPGTNRRLDAKFCIDSHRIAFNSLRRSGSKDQVR